jgi:hypothetical protein
MIKQGGTSNNFLQVGNPAPPTSGPSPAYFKEEHQLIKQDSNGGGSGDEGKKKRGRRKLEDD